jgi:Ser/Thr protein kinase RdoA (MazF antagonist)
MLPLKHLFNNVDLAEMLVKNWEFDNLEWFQYYRISSNAIYPFQSQGKTQFLRFAPKLEKNRENILAELEFIKYLRDKQYGVLETVAAKNGEVLIEKVTPWGEYYASVFERVPGKQLGQTDLSDSIIYCYGKSLGKLHQLSSEYEPKKFKRRSYSEVLDWMQHVLLDSSNETYSALEEINLLKDYFEHVPITKSNFGLIHYDFETDNVFYDEQTNVCHAIDFDDSMYHWYVMDIQQALDSLEDCISPELFVQKKQSFMEGYRSEFEVTEEMLSILPACQRFADLFGYVRLLHTAKEQWDHEPEWLSGLREKLTKSMNHKSLYFGEKVLLV